MPELADLYPGYEAHWIDTSAGRIFARAGGAGPPLLLLHGYPQTNVIWHKIAPTLATKFRLVIPDLPGYGWSEVARARPDHAPYTKRAMANAMIELMEALGHARFALVGHDRGGRVGYRLALDHPGRLSRLAVIDIVPTHTMWHEMDAALAYKVWHWTFLALPAPFPETMIGRDPTYYLDWKLASWSGTKDLTPFDPRALVHYRTAFQDPLRIHASCEDYRAGHTTDLACDDADRLAGRKIACPVLALWGSKGIPSENTPLAVWREWSDDVRGRAIDSGHFPQEENPLATAAALMDFLTATA
jgi:haloacetate dehalogenase